MPLTSKSIALATKFYLFFIKLTITLFLIFKFLKIYIHQYSSILKGCREDIPEIHINQILKELHFGNFGKVKMKSLVRSFV